jgi:hypothetical protein
MKMKKAAVGLLVILGLVFIGLAIYYWITPAGSLPHSFPGYQAGSVHKHLKHGFAALVLGMGSWVLAWFLSGNKTSGTQDTEKK